MKRFLRRVSIVIFLPILLPVMVPVVAVRVMIEAMHFDGLWALIKEEWNK